MAGKNVKDQVFDFGTIVEPTQEQEKKEVPYSPNEKATSWSGTQGIKGAKLPRMNLAFHPETYNKIKTESRKLGKTYSEFLTMLVQEYEG